jgi:hypothetical protein
MFSSSLLARTAAGRSDCIIFRDIHRDPSPVQSLDWGNDARHSLPLMRRIGDAIPPETPERTHR